jgi:hypothetical protein
MPESSFAASTFAERLQHFAYSVDTVDSGTFEQVRDLVSTYVMKELHGEYFELSRSEETTDGSAALLSRLLTSSR